MAGLQAALDSGTGLADPIVILMLHILGNACRDITFRAEILPRAGETLTFQQRRPNGVFRVIVVDLEATLFKIDSKQRPLGKPDKPGEYPSPQTVQKVITRIVPNDAIFVARNRLRW